MLSPIRDKQIKLYYQNNNNHNNNDLGALRIIHAGQLPYGSSREMTVGATSGGAGARVVEHGDEGVGRVADHGLQVKAVLGEGRDRKGALPAGP